MINPITFSIAEEKIISYIPKKIKILSSLIPGDGTTYIYNNEIDYYNEYRQSYFAKTTKKSGWDCMRHYEILANGCIPYFPDLEKCSKKTLALFPKDLIYEGNNLYNKFSEKNIDDLTITDINEYNILVEKLLNYTKNYLTTSKMAKYILEKTNHKNAKKILYLSGDTSPDYLRCVTLHGFKELLGKSCHDYPKILHIYKSNDINYKNLYGKGFTYTNLLDSNLLDNNLDNNIEECIKNKYYDIVIYGSYHRGTPYIDLINKIYKPNEIIFICGEDIHNCNYSTLTNYGYNVFVREL